MRDEADFFRNNKWLYHYTKFDTARIIIDTMELKYSELRYTNDACENAKVIYNNSCPGCNENCDLEKIENEVYLYRQLSLSEDKMVFGRRGFDLQQMWGLYANKGFGVCLVFDKSEFIDSLPSSCVPGSVSYIDNLTADTMTQISNNNDITTYVNESAKNIFFIKRKEWEHEQEYRIICKVDGTERINEFHNFQNSLKYVVLFNSKSQNSKPEEREESILNSVEYKCLKRLLPPRIKILVYASFCGQQSLTCYEDDSNGIEYWNSLEEYRQIVDIDV